jgi:hypothetical protein
VAHAYNPSYLGGRDQEDHGLKPAWANSSERSYLKNRAGGVAQGEGPEFKPSSAQQKKHMQSVFMYGWEEFSLVTSQMSIPGNMCVEGQRGGNEENKCFCRKLPLSMSENTRVNKAVS